MFKSIFNFLVKLVTTKPTPAVIPTPEVVPVKETELEQPKTDFKLAWDGKHPDSAKWTVILVELLKKSLLPDLMPSDVQAKFPVYNRSREDRIHFWAQVISIMAKFESGYKPECTYEEGFNDTAGKKVISRGLLQISQESANSYGAQISEAVQLHDVTTNLRTGIMILTRWVEKDNVFTAGMKGAWRGGSRYWSVLRDNSGSKPKIMDYLGSVDWGVAPSAPEAPKPSNDLNRAVLNEAIKYIGVHEKGGNNQGPEVEMFQKAVDGKAQGEAWCMAFVQFCIKQVEAKHGVKSKIYHSEACQEVYKHSPDLHVKIPEPGNIIVWYHEGSYTGHTGFVESVVVENGKIIRINTIEGNTSDASMRDGDSVARRERDGDGYGTLKVMGFLKAF